MGGKPVKAYQSPFSAARRFSAESNTGFTSLNQRITCFSRFSAFSNVKESSAEKRNTGLSLTAAALINAAGKYRSPAFAGIQLRTAQTLFEIAYGSGSPPRFALRQTGCWIWSAAAILFAEIFLSHVC
ncbi:MAG: hypothetical protein ACTTIT_07890 [Treponema sp.]